jgi:TonB family protein
MSANILLIEYEPSSVDGVRNAMTGQGHRLEVVGDLNAAVETCAHFEPKIVIITAELAQVPVGDAITQLRARAGLRSTPFLILMAGYRGENPKADAVEHGAQDILARPFTGDELQRRVEDLLRTTAGILTTQAVPQETLDALRRGTAADDGESFTSDDLFADILSDVEREGSSVKAAPATPRASREVNVDDVLADVLGASKHAPEPKRSTSEADVDAMLSKTLAGLEISPSRPAAKKAPEAPVEPPARPAEPPASAEAAAEVEEPKPAPAQDTKSETATSGEMAAPVPSGSTFGQYVLEEHIATGGMAQVYKARMLGLEGFQKTVAIKRILPHLTSNEEFVKMFIDEAKLAAQLNHPNIIHIYDLGKIDRSYYIAMEYIEGCDLRFLLDRCRNRKTPVPVPIALFVANLLAGALDYAHKKRDFDNRDLGLVHRDVSPQNVLISSVGDIKLCDFGIAKAASKASHTRAGALKGKLQYMSPEQAWGKDIDHRSDVFSLGLVLYEMLTAHKVFSGDSELSILEQVRNPAVDAPSNLVPSIPAEVDRIVLKALDPDRAGRYQSALDFQRDCEAVLKSRGWKPDAVALVGFIDEIRSGAAISDYPVADDEGVVPPTPPIGPPPGPPASKPEPKPEEPPEPPIVVEAVSEVEADEPTGKGGAGKWLWIAIVLILLGLAAGWWFFFGPGAGGNGSLAAPTPVPAMPAVEESPTPVAVDDGLMDEAELLERAREVASAEMAKQEQELRERLEKEFPTPTPLPPTATPTDTPTDTPTPSPTATRVPPTPTRIPPTATPIPPTPTPVVLEGDIVEPGPGVVEPVLIHRVDPEYPPIAQRAGIAGEVTAEILVGIDGRVEEIRNIEASKSGVGFERSAEEAVRQWRYRPATKNGVKVRVWIRIKINLTLG